LRDAAEAARLAAEPWKNRLRYHQEREADPCLCRDFVGGRGLQARLLSEHLEKIGPLKDPLSPEKRIIIDNAVANDTPIPTAGRGSCTFVGTMTRSPELVSWVPGHKPVYGMIAHSSCGGLFHNMLKRAGIDQLIIDGKADRPVRIQVIEDKLRIVDAEGELFQVVDSLGLCDFFTADVSSEPFLSLYHALTGVA
jgi:aldehyde:ferredoxin oxidoreductase